MAPNWHTNTLEGAKIDAAGVPPEISGAHALRHTAGTRILEATGDIVAVQRQLRHSNINTSAGYAHRSLEKMRKTVDLLDEDEP